MKIDFDQKLHNLAGTALTVEGEKEPAKLSYFAISALMGSYPDEQTLSGDEKFKRFMLAQVVHNNSGTYDFSVEEIAKIKQLIGKAFTTVVVGAAYNILDGKAALTPVSNINKDESA